MVADYGYVKSRHKLPKFMAAVIITINVMVMVAPVGDAFSTVTVSGNGKGAVSVIASMFSLQHTRAYTRTGAVDRTMTIPQ
jgi:hypothetical protein